MASKRTTNRLYWALVNAMNDNDDQNAKVLQSAYTHALTGNTDANILRSEKVQQALDAIEEIHGPAGVRQVSRARPRYIREYVDGIRDLYTKR